MMPKPFGPGCKPRRLLKLDCMDYRPSMGSLETPYIYAVYIHVHDILCWEQSHIPRWDMFVRLGVHSKMVFLSFNEPGARNRQDLQNLRPPNIRKTFPSLITSL